MSTQRFVLTVLLIVALLAPGAAASVAEPGAPPAAATSWTTSGSMLFIENAGQWPDGARFQVWGSLLGAGTTWLAKDAIWLVVGGGEWDSGRIGDEEPFSLSPSPQTAIKLTFPGSNPDVRIEPFDPLTTAVSYFIGNNPAQWHPDVPVWGGVRYVNLYPDVDLELSAARARLATRPGADLDAVALRVEGASEATVDGDTLLLSTAAGEVRLPLLTGDELPAARAQVQPRGLEVFEVTAPFAAHSPAPPRPTDDPADLLYSTFLGGSGDDIAYAVVVDETGRTTVAGRTISSDFPTTPGAFDPSYNGGEYYGDAFVARLNAAGSALDYATFLGGSDDDQGYAIAVDSMDRTIVTGRTGSSDFPTTPGAFDPTYNGGYQDAFVIRLNGLAARLTTPPFSVAATTTRAMPSPWTAWTAPL